MTQGPRMTAIQEETAGPRAHGAAPHADAPVQAFRSAMRRIASSVAIITARDPAGQVHGMAATAVISVSMDPPSMLVAVNRSAGIHAGLAESGRFCVNVLSDAQRDLIQAFSNTALREQRFASGDWSEGPEGLPRLQSAVCSLVCDVERTIDYGTHTLFVGLVTHVDEGAEALPLVWLAGSPLGRGSRA